MNNQYGWDNKVGLRPVPPVPPFKPNHGSHDSYAHDCYHEYHGYPHPHELPTHGAMMGSGFMLLNYDPFLVDTTHVKYGNFINMAENVNTRITRRRDESCINLDATFNLTGQIMRNMVLQQQLEKSIGSHFDVLNGVLPIIRSDFTIRLYYTVEDDMGGLVHQAVLTVRTPQVNLHYTDIRDYFVTSLKSIFVGDIPAMNFTGIYNLILEKIEIFADTFNTMEHMSGNMNPYYQFADNNNRIILQHDAIQSERPDGSILVASEKLHEMISFQANITTRLRISFIAFFSELICVPQTFNIWNAMFEPSEEKIDRILNEVTTLKESIMILTSTVDRLSESYTDLEHQVSQNTQAIEELRTSNANLSARLENRTTDLESRIDDLDYRVTTLEKRPLALVRYSTGTEYVRSQLTYNRYGNIYQVAKDFTATTFEDDVANGNIVPLEIDGDTIIYNINTITQEVNEMKNVTEVLQTQMTTVVEQIGNIETSLDKVDNELTFHNANEFPEVGSPDAIYVDRQSKKTYVWDAETQEYVPMTSDIDTMIMQIDVGD